MAKRKLKQNADISKQTKNTFTQPQIISGSTSG